MNENEMFFTVYNDEGKEVECEVLFTTERNGVNYIVYTDNTVDDDGDFRVYANVYDPTAEDQPLLPIATEEEWNFLGQLLAKLQEEAGE